MDRITDRREKDYCPHPFHRKGTKYNPITGGSTTSTRLTELCRISTSKQSFKSTGPSLTVHFSSDDARPRAGFYAKVFSVGKFISIFILVKLNTYFESS